MTDKIKEDYSLFKSIVALLLIIGCIWAAQWQYHRGVDRHQRNNEIQSRIKLEKLPLADAAVNPQLNEWRTVTVSGSFDESRQILLRNRYFEGKYGFEVLTAFISANGREFWVDRGWIQAGATATVRPEIPPLPQGDVSITGRLRLDRSLPQGNFFAIPSGGSGLISEANAQSSNKEQGLDSPFYLDLLSGDKPGLNPKVAASLPELSDGPHLAYALQWLIFGGLVIYGRYLIRREVLTREELGIES